MTSKVVVFLSWFVLFLFSCCHANAIDTILADQSIQDGQTIISSKENFALGFFSPGGGESRNRYVGIWYNKISEKYVVWVANRNNPIQDRSGTVTIGRDGNLVVLDGTGRPLWSTNVSNVTSNSSVILWDSGNLLLCDDDDKASCNPDNALWQSFNEPTDTYLPGMKVGLNPRSIKDYFTSWKSETDPSNGNYSLGVDPQGLAEFIIWEGSRKLWRSGLWNGQIFLGVPNMTANYLSGFRIDDEATFFKYTVHNNSQIVRFRIRWDGIGEQLLWDEGKKAWTTFWSQPTRDCEHYNRCGNFGICANSNSQLCSCLRGFEPASRTDWDSGNWSGGCVRRTELQCDRNITSAGEGERNRFFEMESVKFPDFSISIRINSRDNCAAMCLNNCSCKAYAFVSGIQCLQWSQDFVDIQKFEEGGQTLYIRLAASELGTSKNKLTLVIVLVVLGAIFILCTAAYIFWRCRSKSRSSRKEAVIVDETKSREFWTEISAHEDVEGNPAVNGPELPMYSLQDIITATNNFSSVDKLGEGGFGPVFKGKLPCGKEVAVKRLSRKSGQGLEEFKNEIILIAKLQHRNLVRLLGYCVEREEKILLYEFLPNKSLDALIFAKTKEQLNWRKRLNIIEGVARGLLYLHRDSRFRIIHRDLKASNILLDEEMNPKISDFGMAKIFGGNENEGNTNRVVGTYGYMAPEYAMEGLFSVKSDVYSFGVLLLEIVSGKKNQFRHPDYAMNLIGYAWNLWGEERAIEFVDPSIRDSCSDQSSVMRCINVGLLCVQDSPNDRPILSTVVLMLESDTAILPTPRQPTFTMGRNPMKMELRTETSSEVLMSKNNMTNTMVVGR